MQAQVTFGTYSAKHPSEVIEIPFEWFPLVAQFWESGRQYDVNTIVQPRIFTGFAYSRTGGGQSEAREPSWPKTLGGTVIDGNGGWIAVASNSGGSIAVSAPSVEDATGELTISNVSVVNGYGASSRVMARISGGQAGNTYALKCAVTVGALTLVGTLSLPVSNEV